MTNPLRGELELPGVGRRLRFTTNAICAVEARTKTNLAAILVDLDAGQVPDFLTLRVMIWAGLLDTSPEVSIDDAGTVVDTLGYVEALKLVSKAISAAHGPAKEDDPGKNG